MADVLLDVVDLGVAFGPAQVIKQVSFQLERGRILGIVGESGSGKSTLIWALTKLLPAAANLTSGQVWFEGRDLLRLTSAEMRHLRGNRISYISQDPMTSLAPGLTIGRQMTDVLFREPWSARKKRAKVIEALEWVRLPNPSERLSMFPHQLSGGQRQRVSIAMALMLKPGLVLADEPTTALDPTLEVEILELLRRLQRETGAAVIFVTHHLGVVASLCDQVLVMKDGDIREAGAVSRIFARPTDDYTKKLLLCDPAQIVEPQRRLPTMSEPTPRAPLARTVHAEGQVATVDGLTVSYPIRGLQWPGDPPRKPVVSNVSFSVARGETVALIGESGSGKTTIARSLLGLMPQQQGQITLCGQPMAGATPASWRSARAKIAMMFQDPIGSLSPRMSLGDQVVEPLIVHGRRRDATRSRALELLALAGLDPRFADRYAHEVSGGQARRACVARALALSPELLVADEPTAGLDVSIQGEVINLLNDLQERLGLPNSMHADYAIRAARAGKHVMVEKPLANTVEEAEAMIAAAREAGVFLMTAYRLHNEPGTLAVLNRIRDGAIGRPLIFQSVFSFQTQPGNHRLKAHHWGGPLQDVGVYCLNAARHVFGEEPVEAVAMRHQPQDDPRFAEIEATIAATLRFPSGGLAQFVASFGAAACDSYRVVGTEGDLTLDPGFKFESATHLQLRKYGKAEEVDFPQVDHFAGQLAYFSDCINSATPPEADGEEGLADLRALLAIEESALTGKPVAISSPSRLCHPTPDMERQRPVTTKRLLV